MAKRCTSHTATGWVEEGLPPVEPVQKAKVVSGPVIKLGGRSYSAYRWGQGCHTCDSGIALELDNLLARGYSYARVARLAPESKNISVDSLRRHFQNHAPYVMIQARLTQDAALEAAGVNVDAMEGMVWDVRAMVTQGINTFMEALVAPDSNMPVPNWQEAAAFGRLALAIESVPKADAPVGDAKLKAFVQEARASLDPADFQALVNAVSVREMVGDLNVLETRVEDGVYIADDDDTIVLDD